MSLTDWFYTYFGKTITEDQGYNVINTFAYAILALFLYFVIVRYILNKLLDKIYFRFCFAVILFVIWGSMLRVMEEPYSTVNIFHRSTNPFEFGFYFITPGIYFMVTGIVILSLFVSWIIEKYFGIDKLKTLTIIGFILLIPTFIFMLTRMTFIRDFFLYVFAIAVIIAIIYYITKQFKITYNKTEILAITGQIVDGIATFSALTFYPFFREQHILSNALMQGLGTWAFPFIKIIITLIIIFYLRKSDLDDSDKNYILLFIALFGFATGTRDLFSIACHLI